MYGNEHEVLQHELPTRIKPRGKAGPPLPSNTNGLRRLIGWEPKRVANGFEQRIAGEVSPAAVHDISNGHWSARWEVGSRLQGRGPAFLAQVANGDGHREHLRIEC
jgi:hypothetical protein